MYKIISLILIPFFSMSQNLTETVNNINSIFKDHSYNLESPPTYNYRHYRQIIIGKDGKLTLMDFRENKNTHKYFDKTVFCIAYLNDLKIGRDKDLPENEYSIFVDCKKGNACVLEPETPMLNASNDKSIDFRFDDKEAREKFTGAFTHLLELAKSNKEFKK